MKAHAGSKHIDLTSEQTDDLIERVKNRSLEERDYEIVLAIVETVLYLQNLVALKHRSIGDQRQLKLPTDDNYNSRRYRGL